MSPVSGRVLIAAGSDSGGGAGIQADIKTVTALGGYAMTAITALTAQNTQGVFGIVGIDPAFIAEQMRLVLTDIGADVLKTGMLHDAAVIETVAAVHGELKVDLPLVVDPVMIAKGGQALLDPAAMASLKSNLLSRAAVATPNLPEAAALADMEVCDVGGMKRAAERIVGLGAAAVLVKGGHLPGDRLTDVLLTADGFELFEDPRIATRHTHGTGCTLASAIAAGLAQGLPLIRSVERARAYVRKAIETAPGLGNGHGPLNHGHTVGRFP